MRKSFHTLTLLVLFVIAPWIVHADDTNSGLMFYVVSQEKIEGGRFIDTADHPRVGFIAVKPDLTVTNLQEVSIPTDPGQSIIFDKSGKATVVTNDLIPALALALNAEDTKRFAALTERSIGKRLLIMLGDKPLSAPEVMAPIENGRFLIEFRDPAALNKPRDALKRLIR